jgi:hypothetical protein
LALPQVSYSHYPMKVSLHFGTRKAISLMGGVVSLIGALMMFALPMQRAHQFTDHFRTREVRRTIERHTFLAQPEADPAERVAHIAILPALPVPVETCSNVKPLAAFEITPHVPLTRLLLRLKLGPSRASAQDPLL